MARHRRWSLLNCDARKEARRREVRLRVARIKHVRWWGFNLARIRTNIERWCDPCWWLEERILRGWFNLILLWHILLSPLSSRGCSWIWEWLDWNWINCDCRRTWNIISRTIDWWVVVLAWNGWLQLATGVSRNWHLRVWSRGVCKWGCWNSSKENDTWWLVASLWRKWKVYLNLYFWRVHKSWRRSRSDNSAFISGWDYGPWGYNDSCTSRLVRWFNWASCHLRRPNWPWAASFDNCRHWYHRPIWCIYRCNLRWCRIACCAGECWGVAHWRLIRRHAGLVWWKSEIAWLLRWRW